MAFSILTRAMRRRTTRSFRPAVSGLESRDLLSNLVGSNYNGVVGGQATAQVVDAYYRPIPAAMIDHVTWYITGADSKPNVLDSTGLHETPMPYAVTTKGDTLSWYWDANPGNRTVTAYTYYVNPQWMGLPIPAYYPDVARESFNVVQPRASFVAPPATGAFSFLPNPELGSVDMISVQPTGKGGIDTNIKVDPNTTNGFGGSFGVINTAQIDAYRTEVDGSVYRDFASPAVNGTVAQSAVLLDHDPAHPLSAYYPQMVIGKDGFPMTDPNQPGSLLAGPETVAVGQPLHFRDSPGNYLNLGFDAQITDSTLFKTQVIYTSPNGSPVPIGQFNWGFTAHASLSPTGVFSWMNGFNQPTLVAPQIWSDQAITATSVFAPWSATVDSLQGSSVLIAGPINPGQSGTHFYTGDVDYSVDYSAV